MPPPEKAKKKAQQREALLESDAEIESLESTPRQRDPKGLSKIARLGVPDAPARDFDLPPQFMLAGTMRERIKLLCKSIHRPQFLCTLRSTNFFDIRSETELVGKEGIEGKRIHFGEIYSAYEIGTDLYTNQRTPAHAWLILLGSNVHQWHTVHPACEFDGIPTFLLSLENYLMYVHLRIGEKLPSGIFDTSESLQGWKAHMYDSSDL